jgi:hypothetical protein
LAKKVKMGVRKEAKITCKLIVMTEENQR